MPKNIINSLRGYIEHLISIKGYDRRTSEELEAIFATELDFYHPRIYGMLDRFIGTEFQQRHMDNLRAISLAKERAEKGETKRIG